MNIAIIGGDLRQITLAELFERDGAAVRVYGVNSSICPRRLACEQSVNLSDKDDIVILPMPVSYDGVHVNTPFGTTPILLEEILSHINVHTIVFGGKIPPDFFASLYDKGVAAFDYAENEELMIKNAVPTAEGAAALAINETPITVWRSKCLIIGWGRIGKALARILTAMGANVTVAARRSESRAEVECVGMESTDTDNLIYTVSQYDIIFNTVPARLLTKPILTEVKRGAVIIDLASKPGGVDIASAKTLGVRVIWALSLPGRIAPITSGEIIKETISNILGGGIDGTGK